MQRIAQSWLVLELTESGTAVGGVVSLQFLPILVISPIAGVLADRMDKRKLLYLTQSVAALMAATLGTLVLLDRVELWMVYALAFGLGIVSSFDNPTRRAFIIEMVGRDSLTNAEGLNSVLVNGGRVLGPAIGGLLIVWVGLGICFLLNALSYLGLIVALARMRSDELVRPEPAGRGPGQLREGFRYAAGTPTLRVLLMMLAVISIFAYEYEVVLPLLARFTFGGDADTFGLMFAATALGAVLGGLHFANRTVLTVRSLVNQALAYGAALIVVALSPGVWFALAALVAVGATGSSMLGAANSMLQLATRPEMQGRVVALRSMAFLGSRPIGAIAVGWVGENIGPRQSIALGSVATVAIALWVRRRLAGVDQE
jgi:MFS family permease